MKRLYHELYLIKLTSSSERWWRNYPTTRHPWECSQSAWMRWFRGRMHSLNLLGHRISPLASRVWWTDKLRIKRRSNQLRVWHQGLKTRSYLRELAEQWTAAPSFSRAQWTSHRHSMLIETVIKEFAHWRGYQLNKKICNFPMSRTLLRSMLKSRLSHLKSCSSKASIRVKSNYLVIKMTLIKRRPYPRLDPGHKMDSNIPSLKYPLHLSICNSKAQ